MTEESSEIGRNDNRIREPHAYLIDQLVNLTERYDIRLNINYDRYRRILDDAVRNPNQYSDELGYIPFNTSHVISIKVDTFLITEDEKTCCICMETPHTDKMCQTNCQHKFCVDCLTQYTKTKQTCPLCRTLITDISVSTEEICSQLRATI